MAEGGRDFMGRRRESLRTFSPSRANAQPVDYDSVIRNPIAGGPVYRDLYWANHIQRYSITPLGFDPRKRTSMTYL